MKSKNQFCMDIVNKNNNKKSIWVNLRKKGYYHFNYVFYNQFLIINQTKHKLDFFESNSKNNLKKYLKINNDYEKI